MKREEMICERKQPSASPAASSSSVFAESDLVFNIYRCLMQRLEGLKKANKQTESDAEWNPRLRRSTSPSAILSFFVFFNVGEGGPLISSLL